MIAVGTELFCELGYGRTSMEMVALRAGVSKPTLYRLFENKKSLFAAALDRHRLETFVIPPSDDMPLAEALGGILRADLDRGAFREQMRIVEMGLAEEAQDPDLREVLRNHGADPTRDDLAAWLARRMERGELRRAGDPRMLAGVILGLMFVMSHFPDCGSEEDVRPTFVRLCVDLFLHGLVDRTPPADHASDDARA
ncbi:MAG: TetR/AcrR family transcriptional regulator [Phyllobacteriaceae bacterium]|nr:TetR/AcrR family transcriptional regulator [Phyllobacteriaceae bacterium]